MIALQCSIGSCVIGTTSGGAETGEQVRQSASEPSMRQGAIGRHCCKQAIRASRKLCVQVNSLTRVNGYDGQD